uniref:Uncharacterized protein n=1 Tax=Glossina austeni TaxID=7395 RepID=A0A1A9VQC3_GLOAU
MVFDKRSCKIEFQTSGRERRETLQFPRWSGLAESPPQEFLETSPRAQICEVIIGLRGFQNSLTQSVCSTIDALAWLFTLAFACGGSQPATVKISPPVKFTRVSGKGRHIGCMESVKLTLAAKRIKAISL